jgi:hypothetical protein
MGYVLLPAPSGELRLDLTLDLVEKLEDTGGSLFKTADMLVDKTLPLTDIVRLLRVAYAQAGFDGNIAEFLLAARTPPALLLKDILLGILAPLHRMGAVADGENDLGETITGTGASA